MYRNNSQKPSDEMYAKFRQGFSTLKTPGATIAEQEHSTLVAEDLNNTSMHQEG
jgi:hypothetical protein